MRSNTLHVRRLADSSGPHPTDTVTTMTKWDVESSHGPAASFHDRPLPLSPAIWIHSVSRPTLVLGSRQKESMVLANEARQDGYEVCTRRSGGGLVFIDELDSCWIDVVLPIDHDLWQDDISTAFFWLGDLWADLLSEMGVPNCEVHRGPLTNRVHGQVLCFAGLGPGEVTAEGSKIVGMSQRRTRLGARFQVLLVRRWDADPLLRYVTAGLWPDGLDPESVRAGHPSITPAMLRAIPELFIERLTQNTQ